MCRVAARPGSHARTCTTRLDCATTESSSSGIAMRNARTARYVRTAQREISLKGTARKSACSSGAPRYPSSAKPHEAVTGRAMRRSLLHEPVGCVPAQEHRVASANLTRRCIAAQRKAVARARGVTERDFARPLLVLVGAVASPATAPCGLRRLPRQGALGREETRRRALHRATRNQQPSAK